MAEVRSIILHAYDLSFEIYDNSLRLYVKDAELAEKIGMLERTVVESRILQTQKSMEIPKQEAFDLMKRVEEAKVQIMAQIQVSVNAGKILPRQVPIIVETHKTRIFDKLFFETGVEEEFLHYAIIKHKFRERKIFENMVTQAKKDLNFTI